jgi:hypothetical protein
LPTTRPAKLAGITPGEYFRGKHFAPRLLTDYPVPIAATFNGRRRALTTTALLRSFVTLSLVTLKIVAAIHWES